MEPVEVVETAFARTFRSINHYLVNVTLRVVSDRHKFDGYEATGKWVNPILCYRKKSEVDAVAYPIYTINNNLVHVCVEKLSVLDKYLPSSLKGPPLTMEGKSSGRPCLD